MSRTLKLELPDEIYAAVQRLAAETGKAPEIVALEGVERHVAARSAPPDRDSTDSWFRLRRHAGAVDSGDRQSADATRIEADLASEYGGGHTP